MSVDNQLGQIRELGLRRHAFAERRRDAEEGEEVEDVDDFDDDSDGMLDDDLDYGYDDDDI